MNDPAARSSRLAALAALSACGGAAAAGLGVAGARVGLLAPYAGFRLFALGLLLGGFLGLVLGLVGVLRTRARTGRGGRGRAWLATTVGLALLVLLLALAAPARHAPPIHDLTTDPADPPVFTEAGGHPDNAGRDLTYPHGGPRAPELQRRAYPDLRPIVVAADPAAAFEAAVDTATDLGWTLTWASAEAGLIEAFDTSPLFRFVDDVVIRIRPAGDGGSVVNLRSTSRVGVSDLGANAERIRSFRRAFERSLAAPAA